MHRATEVRLKMIAGGQPLSQYNNSVLSSNDYIPGQFENMALSESNVNEMSYDLL